MLYLSHLLTLLSDPDTTISGTVTVEVVIRLVFTISVTVEVVFDVLGLSLNRGVVISFCLCLGNSDCLNQTPLQLL